MFRCVVMEGVQERPSDARLDVIPHVVQSSPSREKNIEVSTENWRTQQWSWLLRAAWDGREMLAEAVCVR